ncbi:MAG: DUF4214 domain-containing protein, partial [Candidatus Saccharimonadales bacterium]
QEHTTAAISAAYQKLLHRAADQPGLDYWTTRLASGLTDGNLLAGIAASPEYMNRAGSVSSWIDNAYQDLLGRPADPAGQSYWLAQMTSGLSHYDVASRLLAGGEGQLAQIANAYSQYLSRSADSGALSYWSGKLEHGGSLNDVVAGLTASQEFLQRATKPTG